MVPVQAVARTTGIGVIWRQSMVEFLDSIEVVPPESREQRPASRREGLLLRLKLENDSLAKQRAFFPMFGTFEFSGK